MIDFFVEGDPVTKGSMIGHKLADGRVIVMDDFRGERGRRLQAWMKAIAWEGRMTYKGQPIAGPVVLHLAFHLLKPKSNKKPYPSQRPDIDKLVRAVLDAIQTRAKWGGTLIVDDSQVVSMTARKTWGEAPGVQVTVESLEPEQERLI